MTILHGEQEFVFFGESLSTGTELTVTQRLELAVATQHESTAIAASESFADTRS
jgi:hypothetical protein